MLQFWMGHSNADIADISSLVVGRLQLLWNSLIVHFYY